MRFAKNDRVELIDPRMRSCGRRGTVTVVDRGRWLLTVRLDFCSVHLDQLVLVLNCQQVAKLSLLELIAEAAK